MHGPGLLRSAVSTPRRAGRQRVRSVRKDNRPANLGRHLGTARPRLEETDRGRHSQTRASPDPAQPDWTRHSLLRQLRRILPAVQDVC